MEKEQIGKMDFLACKSCKNQAGPRGCNSGACFEESISVNEENGIITCNYYIIADQIVGDDFKGPGGHVSSPDCYCRPVLDFIDEETGNEVWVHNDIQNKQVRVHNNKL